MITEQIPLVLHRLEDSLAMPIAMPMWAFW